LRFCEALRIALFGGFYKNRRFYLEGVWLVKKL